MTQRQRRPGPAARLFREVLGNKTILKLEHVSKAYPGVQALDDVSVESEAGEVHALMGENGAGKSTLIKVIGGAVRPTEGKIILNGKTFSALTPAASAQNGVGVIYREFQPCTLAFSGGERLSGKQAGPPFSERPPGDAKGGAGCVPRIGRTGSSPRT